VTNTTTAISRTGLNLGLSMEKGHKWMCHDHSTLIFTTTPNHIRFVREIRKAGVAMTAIAADTRCRQNDLASHHVPQRTSKAGRSNAARSFGSSQSASPATPTAAADNCSEKGRPGGVLLCAATRSIRLHENPQKCERHPIAESLQFGRFFQDIAGQKRRQRARCLFCPQSIPGTIR
jgi:hypothetical protein